MKWGNIHCIFMIVESTRLNDLNKNMILVATLSHSYGKEGAFGM